MIAVESNTFSMRLTMSQFIFIFIILNVNVLMSIIIPFKIIKRKCQDHDFKIGGQCEASISDGVPVIDIKVGGWPEPIKFCLDSGSDTSYVVRGKVRCYTVSYKH